MAEIKSMRSPPADECAEPLSPEERALLAAIRAIRFGTVEVTVHQARIVQLVRSEKQRFEIS